jgi:hypothetical protein
MYNLYEHSITKYVEDKSDININGYFSEWHRKIIHLTHSSCEFIISSTILDKLTKLNISKQQLDASKSDTDLIRCSGAMIGAYDEISFILLHAFKKFIKSYDVSTHIYSNCIKLLFKLPQEKCNDRMSHLHGDYCVEFFCNNTNISRILIKNDT